MLSLPIFLAWTANFSFRHFNGTKVFLSTVLGGQFRFALFCRFGAGSPSMSWRPLLRVR